MKKVLVVLGLVLASAGFFARSAHAAAPTLSVSSTGSGDSVQINVSGDPNAGVGLYFSGTSGLQVQALGNTSSSGSLSTSISSSQYGVVAGSSVYVVVNSQQSPSTTWPTYTTSSTGTLVLSQTGVVLGVGQSSSITASNNGSNSLYVSNNSNPAIANTTLSGSQITITANNQGSTVVTVCSAVTTSNCASIYVTVQNSGSQSLTFSQNNITVASGQSVPVTISGGTGVYTVLNNSNASVIQTSLSGATVNLSTNSSSGSATITICSSNVSACGIINVTAGTTSSSGVTFSQSNPVLTIGQSLSIYLYGGSSYYVSSNTSSSAVQATIANGTLSLFGNTSGSATITVCSTTGSCGTITATVSSAGGGGTITLSQNTVTLLTGQTLSVTVSGGSTPYNLPAFSTNIFQASLNGNVVTLSGVSAGSSLLTVCSASGGCTTLTVTVNGTASTGTSILLGQSSVSVNSGQTSTIYISGNGGYYVSNNSNQNIASASISSNSVIVSGVSTGTANITVCQTGGQCAILMVTVNGATGTTNNGALAFTNIIPVGQSIKLSISGGTGTYYVSSSASSIVAATLDGSMLTLNGEGAGSASVTVCSNNGCSSIPVVVTNPLLPPTGIAPEVEGFKFTFTLPLRLGSSGNEVTELQKRLTKEGIYSGPITGYYGDLTVAAVKKYQSNHGLETLGSVGPGTRNLLNK